MNIKLISANESRYPRCGLFIEGPDLVSWLDTLTLLGIDPTVVEIYGLPGNAANVIWGSLILGDSSALPDDLGRYAGAHSIANKLIVPEKSQVVPSLTSYDLTHLFKEDKYVFHPEFGLFKLETPIALNDHLAVQEMEELNTFRPLDFEINASAIVSFRIEATPVEELKEEISLKTKREKIPDKPLTIIEKAKLHLYRQFITITEKEDGEEVVINPVGASLESLAKRLGVDGLDVKDQMIEDFKDLHERNKKEVDKLLDMLKNNPDEALKYAIPLEEHGYTRGGHKAAFKMQHRGSDFSLFGGLRSGSSANGSVDLGEEYYKLQRQYVDTAQALRKDGNYEKAAFIYMRLLKNYSEAAKTLREGHFYEKAGFVYMEYLKDELKAASCFEEGKIYDKAIELYKKNNKLEKVGDLYSQLGKQSLATSAYQQVVDGYLVRSKYVKASLLCQNKMYDLNQAQDLLLTGWRKKTDALNCLKSYLSNIPEEEEVWKQINYLNDHEVDKSNDQVFLKVLKHEFQKRKGNRPKIQQLAYTMISDLLERGEISGNELLAFNKSNSRLTADTIRYQVNKNKRMSK